MEKWSELLYGWERGRGRPSQFFCEDVSKLNFWKGSADWLTSYNFYHETEDQKAIRKPLSLLVYRLSYPLPTPLCMYAAHSGRWRPPHVAINTSSSLPTYFLPQTTSWSPSSVRLKLSSWIRISTTGGEGGDLSLAFLQLLQFLNPGCCIIVQYEFHNHTALRFQWDSKILFCVSIYQNTKIPSEMELAPPQYRTYTANTASTSLLLLQHCLRCLHG